MSGQGWCTTRKVAWTSRAGVAIRKAAWMAKAGEATGKVA